MEILDSAFVRLMLAAVLALKAVDDFFATALTVAWRTGALGVAERLGRATAGDDYRRLIPLMEAVPVWIHAAWVLAGILYLVAIAGVVFRMKGAYLAVLAAVGLELTATLAGRPISAATGVVVNPHAGAVVVDAVRFILPLILALVLWQSGRRWPTATSDPG